jgi:hypothetical protein
MERIYFVEIKVPYRRPDGTKEWDWKTVPVREAIAAEASVYRCKDCHGQVRLHGKHAQVGPAPRRTPIPAGFGVLPVGTLLQAKPR